MYVIGKPLGSETLGQRAKAWNEENARKVRYGFCRPGKEEEVAQNVTMYVCVRVRVRVRVCVCVIVIVYVCIHSFILAISIAPLQVLYYSEAPPTTARILYWSFTPKRTGNCR